MLQIRKYLDPKYSKVSRRVFQSLMKRDSQQILLYLILMENITKYLILACIKEVL